MPGTPFSPLALESIGPGIPHSRHAARARQDRDHQENDLSPSSAIALGANLGDPAATLVAVRPLLERELIGWGSPLSAVAIQCRWSPLFLTEPVGGPADQPPYLNAVVLVNIQSRPGLQGRGGDPDPLALLRRLQRLEAQFGRLRTVPWGPRSLDLDLLWCGNLQIQSAALTLPHPHLLERSFVLAPLAAIDPQLRLPAVVATGPPATCGELLAGLLPRLREAAPKRLAPRSGWPE